MVSVLDKSDPISVVSFRRLAGTNVYSLNTVDKLTLTVGLLATVHVSDFAPKARSALTRLFPDCPQDAPVTQYIAEAIRFADLELCREMNFYSSPTAAFASDQARDDFSVIWESDDPQMSRAAGAKMVLASGSSEPAAESIPSGSLPRPPLIRSGMDAKAISYLAKKHGWFGAMASSPATSGPGAGMSGPTAMC